MAKFGAVNLNRVIYIANLKFTPKTRVKFKLKFHEKPAQIAYFPHLAKFKQDRFIRLKAKFL
ncbi:hypothetical protein [uncultured Campylobacter sp.]|uniref:hypothetical protein n=1 Tax=uncultured Campylobacter sp. TaxID=218934 RepID=UPI002624C609|nr:hypothetical protein [uncultured Campylobacter sp.]